MSTPDSLRGKVALVTGGARRLGAAICTELAERGAGVVVHFRHSEPEAMALKRTLQPSGFSVRGDLANPGECDQVFREAAEWMGRIDILVNNAARFARDGDVDETQLRDVNVTAPLRLARRVAEQPGGGCIIHMLDSRLGRMDAGAFGAYTATKRELMESIIPSAREWAPHTRVNGVAPGPVLPPEDVREAAGEFLLEHRPTPQDVARAVGFLAESETITGQILFVDGGQHLQAGSGAPA